MKNYVPYHEERQTLLVPCIMFIEIQAVAFCFINCELGNTNYTPLNGVGCGITAYYVYQLEISAFV